MDRRGWMTLSGGALAAVLLLTAGGGCRLTRNQVLMAKLPPEGPSPRELTKISLPTYVIEPPDVLLIDAVKVVPKPPYHIEPLDTLEIFVLGTLPDQNIAGPYPVEADGTIMLGPAYGAIKVSDLTLAEARDAIRKHLEGILTAPEVSVSLGNSAGQQQIEGEHLVGPDGTVNLGTYGSVYVAGMTLAKPARPSNSTSPSSSTNPISRSTSSPTTASSITSSPKGPIWVTRSSGYRSPATRPCWTLLPRSAVCHGFPARPSGSPARRPTAAAAPDPAGQLAGHRRRRRYRHQLAGPARRPRLRRRGQTGRPRQLRGQAGGTV